MDCKGSSGSRPGVRTLTTPQNSQVDFALFLSHSGGDTMIVCLFSNSSRYGGPIVRLIKQSQYRYHLVDIGRAAGPRWGRFQHLGLIGSLSEKISALCNDPYNDDRLVTQFICYITCQGAQSLRYDLVALWDAACTS